MLTEIELFEFPHLIQLDFVYGLGWRAKFTKERWTEEANCSLAFGTLLNAQGSSEINSDEQHAIFAYWLQSAWRLTVGFSNIYCDKFVISV